MKLKIESTLKKTVRKIGDAIRDNQNKLKEIREIEGILHIITLDDVGNLLFTTDDNPVIIVVPDNDTVPIPLNSVITIEQGGLGAVTVSGTSPVVLESYNNGLSIVGQHALIQLIKKEVNTWLIVGGTTL